MSGNLDAYLDSRIHFVQRAGDQFVRLMNKSRFQDYVDELARGGAYGIFIDDTGSPGIQGAPDNYHPERKTWVAVIVPPAQIVEVMDQMPGALKELHHSIGADEFHFTDIYSGTRQFRDVDLGVRLGLFGFMAHIFSIYKFPVIVQTFDPETLAHVRSVSNGQPPDSIPYFNFNNCGDLALFFLLLRLKWFMQETTTFGSIKARVFIDEGFKKHGVAMRIPRFDEVFLDGQICFAKSSCIYPIQLADFAAFSLNRTQLIGGKSTRSLLDQELLRILSPLALNYVNIERREFPAGDQSRLITLADTRPNGPYPLNSSP